MHRITGIPGAQRSAEFYWASGAARSIEGVEVKGWMRGGWARGPTEERSVSRRPSLVHNPSRGALFPVVSTVTAVLPRGKTGTGLLATASALLSLRPIRNESPAKSFQREQ